jgi:uncharacterized protein with HEPN domain
MKLDDRTRLEHMLQSSTDAISFLGILTENDLAENKMPLQAIVRSVEIIGEAASQISQEFRDSNPDVPWSKIIGMRNRLIHAYFDIDHELVYSTVRVDLPVLVNQVKLLLSRYA